ncbi:MAG: hypothetical protein KF757_02835 [Phycisphaeraceae bacterium]|nr:hypothetical protein [Phycisphaeraceae bacterium]MCW5764307.1 hypothetical protein [Phycisphaeraceae bacterium]
MPIDSLDSLRRAVRRIVSLVSARNYAAVEEFTGGQRLSATDIERVVNEYGRTIVDAPPCAFELHPFVHVQNSDPPEWVIDFDLWTQEQGRSDLTLTLRLYEMKDGTVKTEIDDLHTM